MKKPMSKFWNVIPLDDDGGEITLYGDVCSAQPYDWWTGEPVPGRYITPEGFLEDLEGIKDKNHITVRLNSGGGDVYTGIAICNALKGLHGEKTVVVEGLAASAASIIMCAGDDIQVYPGSLVMIHGVSTLMQDWATLEDIKRLEKHIDAIERAMAGIYAECTGLDTDAIRGLMRRETWMAGAEAVEKGFAHTLLAGEQEDITAYVNADRTTMFVAGVQHDIRSFRRIPEMPVKEPPTARRSPAMGNEPALDENKGGERKVNTMDELKAAYPELIAEVEAQTTQAAREAAIAQERERLMGIDEIAASVGSPELVQAAKYGDEPCDAPTLAYRALREQARLGSAFLGDVAADAEKSGANGVGANPNSGNQLGAQEEKSQAVGLITAGFQRITGKDEE